MPAKKKKSTKKAAFNRKHPRKADGTFKKKVKSRKKR